MCVCGGGTWLVPHSRVSIQGGNVTASKVMSVNCVGDNTVPEEAVSAVVRSLEDLPVTAAEVGMCGMADISLVYPWIRWLCVSR